MEHLSQSGTQGLHGAGGAAEAGPVAHAGRVWGPNSTADLGIAQF